MTLPVIVERRNGVAVVTINRADVRNCINDVAARALDEAFDGLERDDSVKSVILTGAGETSFCSGLDLKQLASEGPALIPKVIFDDTGWAGIGQRDFDKPIISAVNGFALAGGLELALSTDFIIAADNAEFGCNEVALGPIADAGACFRLPQWVPLPFAREMLLTGRRVKAEEALRVGLVNRIVPLRDLMPTAIEIAERIAQNSPSSMRITKRLMRQTLNRPEEQAWPINNRYMRESFETPDFMEGPRAFVQGRKPNFNGN